MRYICHFDRVKGWNICKEIEVKDDSRPMILHLTEEEINEIVIKLNQIICQD